MEGSEKPGWLSPGGNIGMWLAKGILEDGDIRNLLKKLSSADSNDRQQAISEIISGLGIQESLNGIFSQANDMITSWRPLIEDPLVNLRQVTQSSLGDVLCEFRRAQNEVQILVNKNERLASGDEEVGKEIIGEAKKIMNCLFQVLDNKIHECLSGEYPVQITKTNYQSSTFDEFESVASQTGGDISYHSLADTSTEILHRRDSSDNDSSDDLTQISEMGYRSNLIDDTSTETQILLKDAKRKLHEIARGKELLEALKNELNEISNNITLASLEEYLSSNGAQDDCDKTKGAVQRLEEYEVEYSKLAKLIRDFSATIDDTRSVFHKLGNTSTDVSTTIKQVKADLENTTAEFRQNVLSITRNVTRFVTDFTGNPDLLTMSIGDLEGFGHHLQNSLNEKEFSDLGIKQVNSYPGLDDWFHDFLQNHNCVQDPKKLPYDKGTSIKHYIKAIILILNRQKSRLNNSYPDKEIKNAIEVSFSLCVKELALAVQQLENDDVTEDIKATIIHVVNANHHLITLKKNVFSQLEKTINSISNSCSNINTLSVAIEDTANRIFPHNNKVTYFILLISGHVFSIVAGALVYYQFMQCSGCSFSPSDIRTIFSAACFIFSILLLSFAARSDSKIMNDKNHDELIKIPVVIIPLICTTIACLIFLANTIAPAIKWSINRSQLVFGGYPIESIIVAVGFAAPIMVMLFSVVMLSYTKIKSIAGDNKKCHDELKINGASMIIANNHENVHTKSKISGDVSAEESPQQKDQCDESKINGASTIIADNHKDVHPKSEISGNVSVEESPQQKNQCQIH